MFRVSDGRYQNVPATRLACTAATPFRVASKATDDTPPVMDANDPMIVPDVVAGLGVQAKGALLSKIELDPGFVHVNVTTAGTELRLQLLYPPDDSFPVPSAKNAILVKQPSCPQLSPGIVQ